MIKKDFHYVLRRVLVYFAILFVFSFINSCDVKAYDGLQIKKYYSTNQDTFINCNDCIILNGAMDYVATSNRNEFQSIIKNGGSNTNFRKNYVNQILQKLDNGTFNTYLNSYDAWLMYGNNTNSNWILFFNYDDIHLIMTNENSNPQYLYFTIFKGVAYRPSDNTYTSFTNKLDLKPIYAYGFTNKNQSTNHTFTNNNSSKYNIMLVSSDDVITSAMGQSLDTTSTIDSLGVVKNKNQEDNVIVSYTFHPTFTNFNTDNFTYQYKIGNNKWLNITSNNVTFNVNQNTTVYFRVLKNSDNSVVDSRSMTITNIMKYNDNVNDNYNVKYTSENKAVQEESSVNRTIDRVTVNFEYFPKQSNLKYQYQFVKSGDSLSTWTDMPSNDYERGYTVTDNGTMYNRILDENDNVLYSSTFTVDSIGKLMFDSDISWYNSLFNKINYGSGIGTIFYLPLKIVQTVHDSYSENCSPINLGSLLGTPLYMPCIDIESIIGSTLYNIIDVIFMGFIALSIIRFIVNVYNRIVSLNFEGNEDGSGALFL